jgi:hypothetical protein
MSPTSLAEQPDVARPGRLERNQVTSRRCLTREHGPTGLVITANEIALDARALRLDGRLSIEDAADLAARRDVLIRMVAELEEAGYGGNSALVGARGAIELVEQLFAQRAARIEASGTKPRG